MVTIVIIAGLVVFADHLKSAKSSADSNVASNTSSSQNTAATPSTSSTNNSSSSSTGSSSSSSSSATSTSSYKDGTYTASSDYFVPHGDENIKVTLTISNGVVTASSITNSEGDPDSAAFQEDFASSYKQYVVGQKISDLQLSVISGASDTTQGFNDAVSQIQSQAQA